jgi:hypothetical protein
MTMSPIEPLEKLWGDLLSCESKIVIRAFEKLDFNSRQNVVVHLKAMASEKGWHIKQKKSARIALKAIESNYPKDTSR